MQSVVSKQKRRLFTNEGKLENDRMKKSMCVGHLTNNKIRIYSSISGKCT